MFWTSALFMNIQVKPSPYKRCFHVEISSSFLESLPWCFNLLRKEGNSHLSVLREERSNVTRRPDSWIVRSTQLSCCCLIKKKKILNSSWALKTTWPRALLRQGQKRAQTQKRNGASYGCSYFLNFTDVATTKLCALVSILNFGNVHPCTSD